MSDKNKSRNNEPTRKDNNSSNGNDGLRKSIVEKVERPSPWPSPPRENNDKNN